MANAHPSNEALLAAVRYACQHHFGREVDQRTIAVSPHERGLVVELVDLESNSSTKISVIDASWAGNEREVPAAVRHLVGKNQGPLAVFRLVPPPEEEQELDNAREWVLYNPNTGELHRDIGARFWKVQT